MLIFLLQKVEELNSALKEVCRRTGKETQGCLVNIEEAKLAAESLKGIPTNSSDEDFRKLF